jgi:RHS repeat-associated protein
MPMKPMILRVALVLVMAVVAVTASARPDLGPGEAVYLVVLTDDANEPEIAALGGRVLESHAGRRLVVLPPSGVEALRQHAGVSYVQRIWMGEPGEPAVVAHEALPEIVSAAAAPPWSTGAYAYDSSGNITSMGADTFGYDKVGRLSQSKVSSQSQTFTYDHYGNLTRLGTRTITLAAENNNRLAGAGIAYDAAGNMTADGGGRTYHYDPVGMVTGIDMTGAGTVGNLRMIYTADDERIMVVEPSVTRYRVRDFAGQVLREWTSSGTVLAWERDYLYAGGDLVAGEVQIDQRRNGQRHYHKDHLGSTRMVTDGARELVSLQNYLPFGTEITSTEAEFENTGKAPRDPKKFTGHERDYFTVANAAGEYVDYMHARYYAPGWGRFLSVDPASANPRLPQSWNRYTYASNNPMVLVDPDGRDPMTAWRVGVISYLIRDKVSLGHPQVKAPVVGGGNVTSVAGKFGVGVKGIDHFSLDLTDAFNGRNVIDLSWQSKGLRGLGGKLKFEMKGLDIKFEEAALLWGPFEKSLIQQNPDKFKVGLVGTLLQLDLVDINLNAVLPYLFELASMGNDELVGELMRKLAEEERERREREKREKEEEERKTEK